MFIRNLRKVNFDKSKLVSGFVVTITLATAVIILFAGQYSASPPNLVEEHDLESETSAVSNNQDTRDVDDSGSGENSKHTKDVVTYTRNNKIPDQNTSSGQVIPANTEPKSQTVVLQINTASKNYSYTVNWTEGMTVFDALNNAHSKFGFSLKFDDFGTCPSPNEPPKTCGAFVKEIHSYYCLCWIYERKDRSGNSLPANAASWQRINENEIIIWKAT